MKRLSAAAAILATTSSAAFAAGLDRSGRSVSFIFEDGNKIQLSAGFADPSVSGTDVLGSSTGGIADSFALFGGAVRYEFNDKISFGLIVEEPFGADILYGTGSTVLANTAATVDSTAITAFGRYKFNENYSVHGGLVYQTINASVTLPPVAGGTTFDFGSDSDIGFMIGAAYEKPEIALRVALTYHSETDHALPTSIPGAPPQPNTVVTTPEQIRLDFQTGVAADTLVFGSVRFSHYSVTTVSPAALGGASLTDLENGLDVELGVGRRFNDKWAGSLTLGWSERGEDDFGSPLSGTNGSVSIGVGASYQASEAVEISGGIRYTRLGDAIATVAGNPVGDFSSNSAVSAGLRVEFGF
jgi:long-subunit fatty acid transport protein